MWREEKDWKKELKRTRRGEKELEEEERGGACIKTEAQKIARSRLCNHAAGITHQTPAVSPILRQGIHLLLLQRSSEGYKIQKSGKMPDFCDKGYPCIEEIISTQLCRQQLRPPP
jgi:hypothetical protein